LIDPQAGAFSAVTLNRFRVFSPETVSFFKHTSRAFSPFTPNFYEIKNFGQSCKKGKGLYIILLYFFLFLTWTYPKKGKKSVRSNPDIKKYAYFFEIQRFTSGTKRELQGTTGHENGKNRFLCPFF
jgi:hypothetical protein